MDQHMEDHVEHYMERHVDPYLEHHIDSHMVEHQTEQILIKEFMTMEYLIVNLHIPQEILLVI